MSISNDTKPHRPFGLTLAILAGVLFYSFIPLFVTGAIVLVESHFANIDAQWEFGDETVEEIARGGDLTGGITRFDMLVQTALAVIFLIIAVFAWRGKPAIMRHIFTFTVLAISGVTLFLAIFPTSTQTAGMSGGSLDALSRLLQPSILVFYVLLPLYVVWYLNRAPARAFYRGYYLPEELEAIAQMQDIEGK